MFFSIAIILLLGFLLDYFFRKFHLPGLLGMLFTGIVCGPHVLDVIHDDLLVVSSDIRMVALVIILLRAGLQLRTATLKKTGNTAIQFAIIPALLEGLVLFLLAPHFLDISYLESAILGTILAAVSPAVVVPFMLNFITLNKGVQNSIPTLMLGATSLNSVFVLVFFSILLGMYSGSDTSFWTDLLRIPEAVLMGIIVGSLSGYILNRGFNFVSIRSTKMTVILIACSIIIIWLEDQLKNIVTISSLLGIMAMGYVIVERSERLAERISLKLSKAWVVGEVLLFVLVGAQVNLSAVWDAGIIGALLILIGLLARSVGGMIALYKAKITVEEKKFCIASFIPKATVQAAVGAVPLELGIPGGEIILAVSVLAIIITAPIGSIAIQQGGKKWLT